MKTRMTIPLIALAVLTLFLTGRAQDQTPAAEEDTITVETPANASNDNDNTQATSDIIQAVVDAQQTNGDNGDEGEARPTNGRSPRAIRGQGTRGTAGSSTNAQSLASLVTKVSTNNTKGLRLNFRNAPLSLVLDYLSDAAGFTISANSKVDLKGTVTVWSNQPVDRNEAIRLLNAALTSSGYAATVEGNLLNIYVLDATNTEIVAGVPDNDYNKIPPTKDLVTQIAYVRNVEASQLISSLEPLMPSGTSMKPNQGANAIIITDTKANIRRMVQLVKALDTASVSESGVRVFPLEYADAATLAQVVQQLFQTDTGNNRNRNGFGGFPGFGGFGGFGGGGGNDGGGRGGNNNSSSAQTGRMTTARVTAVADDRSNSLVVSAGADQMPLIEELVKQMDVNVDDITEVRVFRLRYADPTEMADQLANLFPDTTNQRNQRGQQFGFGPFGGNFGGGGGNRNNSDSARRLKQTRVTAVPDARTGAVIVSAAREMMGQIAGIINELDSDPAKKKKVYVIPVQNRDPQQVVEDLQSVIATDTTSGNFNNRNSTTRQTGSQLNTRQQNNLQNQGNNNGVGGNFGNNGGGLRTGNQ